MLRNIFLWHGFMKNLQINIIIREIIKKVESMLKLSGNEYIEAGKQSGEKLQGYFFD